MYTENMAWKETQSKNQRRKRNKLALLVLLFVVLLLFLSWGINFTRTIFTAPKGSSLKRNHTWNGEFNINLVLRSKNISLFSYNPKEEKIMIIPLPDETFLEVPHGFGSWQIRSVYGLGGDALLAETLASFFAIPVDGFLDLNIPKKGGEIIKDLRENFLSGANYLSFLKTNLTIWELYKLKMGIKGVRFDKVEEFNVRSVMDQSTLADGTQVYTADPVRIDSILSDFTDPQIVAEHKSIAIFNATPTPGLAQKWSRLITNLGGNVIITTNAKHEVKKTQVIGEKSKTLERLTQIFDLDCQNNPKCVKISPADEDLTTSRAQINVFLGEDFISK